MKILISLKKVGWARGIPKDAHEKDVRMKVDAMQGVWSKYTSDAAILSPQQSF